MRESAEIEESRKQSKIVKRIMNIGGVGYAGLVWSGQKAEKSESSVSLSAYLLDDE